MYSAYTVAHPDVGEAFLVASEPEYSVRDQIKLAREIAANWEFGGDKIKSVHVMTKGSWFRLFRERK